jgi:hypothetical protein
MKKSKDELAKERYGKQYKDLCLPRQWAIDSLFDAQVE